MVPGCCGRLGAPGPALAVPWSCGVWQSPWHRTLRTSQNCAPRGGTGGWAGTWEAAGAGPRLGTMGREHSSVGPPCVWACLSSRRARAALHPCTHLGGGSGTPRLQRPVPVPHVHGTASGNLLLVRSLFQANSPNVPSNKSSPFAAGLGPQAWSPHSSPISRAGNPDLTSSARTIPMYNPNSLGCSGTAAAPSTVGINHWGDPHASIKTELRVIWAGQDEPSTHSPLLGTARKTLWREEPRCWQLGPG